MSRIPGQRLLGFPSRVCSRSVSSALFDCADSVVPGGRPRLSLEVCLQIWKPHARPARRAIGRKMKIEVVEIRFLREAGLPCEVRIGT